IISHGFAERKEKYSEAAYYFLKMGYQVFVLDHYGHGESIEQENDSGLVYIEDFDIYVEDLNKFITFVIDGYTDGKPKILYGHSMGGCIGGLFAERHPGNIDGLILNAPMFSINMGIPEAIGSGVTKLSVLLNHQMKS